jgi:2-keto-4-pentenoate hydratase/2-oxohepta-3-ene-1,7-dioic acid hydratase in catechol pathway
MTDHPRFVTFSGNRYGLVHGNGIIDLTDDYPYPSLREAIADGALLRMSQTRRSPDVDFGEATLGIPIPGPEKIICVGVNFPDRNAEYKDGKEQPPNPSLFVRFPRTFVGHNQNIVRPAESPQLDYEGEVVIVIGKHGRRISERDAYDHIAAITLSNEGTVRDWVRHAKFNVTQGKNWDRSGAIGPWLVPFTDAAQLDDIALETRVNGEIRQSDRTSRMVFSFRKIVAYISTFITLVPGDVLICGTPIGAGARFDPPRWLEPGDVIEVEADGIGCLRNGVEDEA